MLKPTEDDSSAQLVTLAEAVLDERSESGGAGANSSLERVLSRVTVDVSLPAATALPNQERPATNASDREPEIGQGLSVGWVESWDGQETVVLSRLDGKDKVSAKVLPALDRGVLEDAIQERQLVLFLSCDGQPMVIGAIRTRKPQTLKIEAENLELTGTKSVLLKAGRAAFELRQDGNIELVGSRISAVSRGLFRVVGRMLRLN